MNDLISRQAANAKMKKYRKKPIVIEAYQTDVTLDIETLEGIMHASAGDYIIIGVNGERYPCKPDIFKKTYEEVSDECLPTAQPERKKGRWYKPTGMMPPEYAGVYRCSECDGIAMRDWKTHKQMLTDFCSNCGADMRGKHDE